MFRSPCEERFVIATSQADILSANNVDSGFAAEQRTQYIVIKVLVRQPAHASPVAGLATDHGYHPAPSGTRLNFSPRESPDAGGKDTALSRTNGANYTQLPDTHQPARWRDTDGRFPPQSRPRKTPTESYPA